MFGLADSTLGIVLVLGGAVLLGLALFILRVLPNRRANKQPEIILPTVLAEVNPIESAVILVEPGGRVAYLNHTARQWFDMQNNEKPNLERMARQARPADAFLSLCATPGQMRFNIKQTLVEGESYALPIQGAQAIMVSLKRPQLTSLDEEEDTLSSQAVRIFTEISQGMSASLDLHTTIEAILESVDRLIPSDFSEITLWSKDYASFLPYRYLIEEDGIRRLQEPADAYALGMGYTSYLPTIKGALLIRDAAEFVDARPALSRAQFPIQSYLGMALKIGETLIGTIELASQLTHSFSQEDKSVLEILSGHAAVALQNAVTHHNEQERVKELSGLADLAQVSRAVSDTHDLYKNILDTISPLIGAEILGFLIYNDHNQTLEGKVPFQGLPEQFVEMYRAEVKPNTKAAAIWAEQDIIIATDTGEDSILGELGLSPVAQASAMQETVLVPLSSGGRPLGYLQAANKRDNAAFSDDDLRLLRIIAGQIAPILENAELIELSQRRARRAEALRRVASLAGSEATQDEALQYSLVELSRFLEAELAMVFLLDESLGTLQVHEPSVLGVRPETMARISLHLITQANIDNTVTDTQTALLSDHLPDDEDLPQPYRALQPLISDIRSFMVAPLVARGKALGEILIGSQRRMYFDDSDLRSLKTAADQIASAIERTNLLTQTDETLLRKMTEMNRLNQITRQIKVTDQIENVLRLVLEEGMQITKADDGGMVLFARQQQPGEALRIIERVGNTPPALTMLDQHAVERKEMVYVPDLSASRYFEDVPPADANSYGSALIMPVFAFGQVVGLFRCFATQTNGFDETARELLRALTAQTGTMLNNIWQYHDTAQRVVLLSSQAQALDYLLETRKKITPDMGLSEALKILVDAVQMVSQFELGIIYVYDPQYQMIKPLASAGFSEKDRKVLEDIQHPWENVSQYLQPEFQHSRSYHVPFDALENVSPLIPDFAAKNYTVPLDADQPWLPGDQLLVPIIAGQDTPLGLIVVDVPLDGQVPDETRLEMLELFASEAGMVIERSHKLEALQEQIEEVETQIIQTEAEIKANQHQPYLKVLLKKDLEQTLALQQLYHRERNIRVGLDIADSINRQPDRQSVLNSLASQMLTEMELDIALVAEPAAGGPRLLSQLGPIPQTANTQALLGQRNPLRQTMQSGDMLFSGNLVDDAEWQNSPLLKSLNARGFISLPINNNGKVEAAVLAISTIPLAELTKEDEQVYEILTNQVTLTLQNLDLLTETQRRLREVDLLLDFSRQLGSLDAQSILNTLATSIRRVLPHAHGVRVMLWDEANEVLNTQTVSGYSDNQMFYKIVQRMDGSVIGKAFRQAQTINKGEVDFAADFYLTADELLLYREATGGRLPVSSLLVPVRTGDSVQGVVELDNFNTTNAFTSEDQALIESLTQQTALALENARLFDESRQINEELENRVSDRTDQLAREHQFTQILLQISAELSSSLDLDMVLNRSLAMLNEATGAEQASIYINLNPAEGLIYRAGAGIHESPPTGGTPSTYHVDSGVTGWAIQNQDIVLVGDLLKDETWKNTHEINPVYRSTLTAPLIVGQEALGCLMLLHRQPNYFDDTQLDPIRAAANQFAVTINNGELFQLIRDQAEDLGTMLRSQQIEASRSTAMLQGVGDGVLVTDNHNEITLFNHAAEEMLGIPRDQIVGKTLEEFAGLFGREAESWMQMISSWSRSSQSFINKEMITEQVALEDGRVISVHLSPVSDRDEFLGTISIFRDITHQVEVDRMKSEFVATVSHELRTPMTPIKGYVEFLLMGGTGDLNDQQREFLAIIKTNIDRLAILVDDLLDVSRIEAGKVALSFQPIHLQGVVEEATNTTLQQSEEDARPVEIEIDIPPNLPSIYGDNDRVRQIITNLVDNAYKYSPENSKIRIRVYPNENNIQVDVIDQGIGIFPDEQDKIFERFYRGENHMVMATAGTGLGLPIVKELVEMHNGKIWVNSSGVPGEGSTFSFTLPIYQTEQETTLLE